MSIQKPLFFPLLFLSMVPCLSLGFQAQALEVAKKVQVPSFDYKNMTAKEVLKLSPSDLSTINEDAFSKIFDTQNISTSNLADQATGAINNLTGNAATNIAAQAGTALNSLQSQATELTQNITGKLESISNMDLSKLSASSLSSLTDLSAQNLSMPTSLSVGGGSKNKISELITLQANINQKISNQTIAKARLLILYSEDLLLHKKIDFSQSKIVQMEKLK